jgi:YhcH/YjgK/YiaL family protein
MITGVVRELSNYIGEEDSEHIKRYISSFLESNLYNEWTQMGNNLRVIALRKSQYTEGRFESHTIYQDIHIVLEGEDTIYLGSLFDSKSVKEYDQEFDYELYDSKVEQVIRVYPGSFVILNPGELHSNEIKNNKTRKVVIKRVVNNG